LDALLELRFDGDILSSYRGPCRIISLPQLI